MFELLPNARIVDTVLPIAQSLFRAHGSIRICSICWFMFDEFFLAAPVTFLYNTLFVYEKKLREKAAFRQPLIAGTIGKSSNESKINW